MFCYNYGRLFLRNERIWMNDLKNINTESDFENRTGLIIWLHSKRNVKRLMNFGVLHYVSKKMNYAIIYVATNNLEKILERLKKENYIKSVEVSQMRDLPINYDDVLTDMKEEIEEKKREEKSKILEQEDGLDYKNW